MQLHNAPSPVWWAVQAGVALSQSNDWMAKARQNKKDRLAYSGCLQMARLARHEYRRMFAYAVKLSNYPKTGSIKKHENPLTLVHSHL